MDMTQIGSCSHEQKKIRWLKSNSRLHDDEIQEEKHSFVSLVRKYDLMEPVCRKNLHHSLHLFLMQ